MGAEIMDFNHGTPHFLPNGTTDASTHEISSVLTHPLPGMMSSNSPAFGARTLHGTHGSASLLLHAGNNNNNNAWTHTRPHILAPSGSTMLISAATSPSPQPLSIISPSNSPMVMPASSTSATNGTSPSPLPSSALTPITHDSPAGPIPLTVSTSVPVTIGINGESSVICRSTPGSQPGSRHPSLVGLQRTPSPSPSPLPLPTPHTTVGGLMIKHYRSRSGGESMGPPGTTTGPSTPFTLPHIPLLPLYHHQRSPSGNVAPAPSNGLLSARPSVFALGGVSPGRGPSNGLSVGVGVSGGNGFLSSPLPSGRSMPPLSPVIAPVTVTVAAMASSTTASTSTSTPGNATSISGGAGGVVTSSPPMPTISLSTRPGSAASSQNQVVATLV
jgi:hypothetical protein